MAFEVKSEIRGKVNVIHLKGEMDSTVNDVFEDEVKAAIEGGQYDLVVGMAELFYLDSSGIGSIIRALRATSKYGGSLIIAGANSAIKTIFDVTRLKEIIDVHPDLDSALGSFDKK